MTRLCNLKGYEEGHPWCENCAEADWCKRDSAQNTINSDEEASNEK